MNFEWGTKLAERQDRAIAALLSDGFPAVDDFAKLRANRLIWLAAIFAPSNLTIRHYALLDLMQNVDKRLMKIQRQYHLLTDCGLWREGHSYWCYTKPVLLKYAETFNFGLLRGFIQDMDMYFQDTAYKCGHVYKAAPFGDLWNGPIDTHSIMPRFISFKPVTWHVQENKITINTRALRFNLHTDTVNRTYDVSSGVPVDEHGVPFKFYTGYWDKYPTKWSEIKVFIKRFFHLIFN